MPAICVLIPLVQGRFLLNASASGKRNHWCLNPFGSGTFFISFNIHKKEVWNVLIPLVQGRFLFKNFRKIKQKQKVLIPLVQGRFLLPRKKKYQWNMCLNPFGSGTFFIVMQETLRCRRYCLNPFGSGTFFIVF